MSYRPPADDGAEAALAATVAPAFDRYPSGGVVLVARRGRVLLRRSYGLADVELGVPMHPDHVLGTGSITKQFTAIAVLQLVAEGRLSLTEDVRRYLPEFPTHGRSITIEQLLTHTSGLANVVDREDFDQLARRDHTPAELLALTRDMPLHFEPGQGFRYSDSGYFVLGAVIERISGSKYGDYLEQRLFRPLGMTDTWYGDDERVIPRRAQGYSVREGALVRASYLSMTVPYAAGAVFSTVDDLLRWDTALRAGEVVPRALLERAWAPVTLPDGTSTGYGFGWKLCTLAGFATIEHGGFINGFLASLLHLPEADTTVIVLTNNDADAPDAGWLARRLARRLLTGSTELSPYTLTDAERAALVGRYEIRAGDVRTIFAREETLHSQRNDGPARPLMALSPTELSPASADGALVMKFELGVDGRVARMRTMQRCEPIDSAQRLPDPAR